MGVMSDKTAKKKPDTATVVPPAVTAKVLPPPPAPEPVVDLVASAAVTAEQFKLEMDHKDDPPPMPPLAPEPPPAPPVVEARVRVRVIEKKKIMVAGRPCTFGLGDILDANLYGGNSFREILSQIRTEPVT